MTRPAFILDLDGTIYRGGTAIPGARGFVEWLRENGSPFLFVTNRANRTPAEVARQLAGMGIACGADSVLTSAQATAMVLGPVRAYVIGGDGIRQAIAEIGGAADAAEPDVVIVSHDPAISHEKLTRATRHVLGGAALVATNADRIILTPEGALPEAGPLVAAIENATGRTARIIGKPDPAIMDAAARRMGVANEDCIAVGDNLMTDIPAAHAAGMKSALVLTGVSRREEIETAPCAPTWVADDLRELPRILPRR